MNFTTWDIETTNWNVIQAIGYYNEYRKGVVSTVDEIIEIMEEIGGVFFAHAAGIFDNKFLLEKIFNIYNLEDIKIKLIHNTVGHIEIKNKFTLRDSFYLFPESLKKLGISFEAGEKMDVDRSNIGKYSKKVINDYVLSDCILLYNILKKAEISGFDLSNLTIAQATFKNWKEQTSEVDLENMKTLDRIDPIFRNAYFGGRTEVFRRYGENLNYYDVRSMYPFVMKNYIYPYGMALNTKIFQKDKLGIYNVEVYIPENVYLPPLPFREEKTGKVLFPVGKFETWATNVELNLLNDIQGAEFKVIKGYYWENHTKPFNDYIDYWYNIKQNSSGAMREIAKKHLNCLYGKLGQKRNFKQISFKAPSDIETMIEKNYTLIWMSNTDMTSENIIVDPEKNQIWVYDEPSHVPYSYVHIALFVTSYARAHLYNIMKKILDRNGNIYYCDTDSIFTDILLETGDNLGELGQENNDKISKAVFVSPKLYSYVENEKNKTKAKGCNSEGFTFDNMMEILHGEIYTSKKEGLIGFMEAVKRKKNWIEMRLLERQIDNKFSKREISNDYNTLPLIFKK